MYSVIPRWFRRATILITLGAAAGAMAQVGVTKRIPQSVAVPSFFPFTAMTAFDMTPDGRYVVFETTAALLAIDANAGADIYRWDRTTNTIELVSLAKDNTPTAGGSEPSISSDGRYVAFNSSATNIVNSPANFTGIVVRDMSTGTNSPISTSTTNTTTSGNLRPKISSDGNVVSFVSTATNLTAGDTNGQQDIFARNRAFGTTVRVSEPSAGGNATGGPSDKQFISNDGRYITFESAATNLVASDTNNQTDVFRKDLQTGTCILISQTAAGAALAVSSTNRGLSDDGNIATFRAASALIVSGGPTTAQIYVRNVSGATTTLGSLLANGSMPTSQTVTDDGTLSKNGRYLTFVSTSDSYLALDTNNASDVIQRDLNLGKNNRVTLRYDGSQTASVHTGPISSSDGRYVGFMSTDGLLVPGDAGTQKNAFQRDMTASTTSLVDRNYYSNVINQQQDLPDLSADGRFVVFQSTANNLVANDKNGFSDVFLYDRIDDSVSRVSLGSGGEEGVADSINPRISGDGNWVAFESSSTTFDPIGSSVARILLRNRTSGQTFLVSKRSTGQPDTGLNASVSNDGRYVAFESTVKLTSEDTNAVSDIYVYDRATQTVKLISVSSAGTVSNGACRNASISADGSRVAFESDATNLVANDFDAAPDVFVRDISANTTSVMSIDVGGIIRGGTAPRMGYDGQSVAFQSSAQLIVVSPAAPAKIYVRNIASGAMTLVGSDTSGGFVSSDLTLFGVSSNGRYVCFQGNNNKLPGFNNKLQTYVQDVLTKDVVLCSRRGATSSDQAVSGSAMGKDGTFVVFRTNSKLLVDDPIQFQSLFLHQVREASTSAVAGTVTLESFVGPRARPVLKLTFEPVSGGTAVDVDAAIGADGSFAAAGDFSGSYRVYAKADTYLRKLVGTFSLGTGTTNVGSFILLNGDCDGDNAVTVFDYSILSDAFDSNPGGSTWDPRADLDGDNNVSVFDYSILSDNFDKSGD